MAGTHQRKGKGNRVSRELFISHYLKNGGNATEAWIEAGGKAGSGARQNAHRVLQEPEVKKILGEKLKKTLEQADITAERVMLELGRRAFADIRDIFTPEGKLRPVSELSADAAATIDGLDIEVDKDGNVTTVKVRRMGKDASLGILARHYKIVGSELDETVGKALAFAERLGRARERVRQMRKTP